MQATRNARKRRQKPAQSNAGPTPTTILTDAARRWKVPLWALVGLKLQESGPSTGPNSFQFEPGTAAANNVDVNNFASSANGAARLLSEYKRKYGSWDAAFEAYNGGPGAVGRGYAYNAADVKAKLNEFGLGGLAGGPRSQNVTWWGDALGGIAGAYKEELEKLFVPHAPSIPDTPFGPAPGIPEGPLGGLKESLGLEDLSNFFKLLSSPETYLRLGEIIAGSVLIYLALKALTGQGLSDLPGYSVARATVPV